MTGVRRTFVIPGEVTHLPLVVNHFDESVCGILLHMRGSSWQRKLLDEYAPRFVARTYTLDSLTQLAPVALEASQWPLYDRCLRAVLADSRVHYMAMRSYFDSALNSTAMVDRVVANSVRIIALTAPERLICSATPHAVEAWIFARCVEEAGIPVFILERTPVNNRAWIYRGLDAQQVVTRKPETVAPLSAYTLQQVEEQIASVAGARDAKGFLVSRMDLSSVKGAEANHWWSYRRELPMILRGPLRSIPIRMISSYVKRRLFRDYQRLAATTVPPGPYVVYFMHYQPERSSLPEGLFHTQQLMALRQLSLSLPAGWKLLVREHPTMWLLPLDFTVRTPNYFEQVAALPRTQLCSMDLDTFELIDGSQAVATLTGSVGFQAILRRKPAIVFGIPAYKDHPACFSVSSTSDVAGAFARIREATVSGLFEKEALYRYLQWVEANSIVADSDEREWLEARLKNFAELYRRIFRGEIDL